MRICKLFAMVASVLLLLLYSVPAATSDNNLSNQQELDLYIQRVVKKLDIPAMSVAISHKGDLVYSRAFGEDIVNETRYYIGSISKSFTALAVMQLVEKGKIGLDSSVSEYIPEFRVSDEITVRHLLNHVSGMTGSDYTANLSPQSEL
jgi:CubicO group peptidase (beta-lactamase class C family)